MGKGRKGPYATITDMTVPIEPPLDPQNENRRAFILSLPMQDVDTVPRQDLARAIRRLWRDPGVKDAVRRSLAREFQLDISAVYFFDAMDRIAAPGYIPTDRNILRCSHVRTAGIPETILRAGELRYRILDVSVAGQRSGKRKWLHCFEDVNALMVVVDLCEYDQMLYEDESVVRCCLFIATPTPFIQPPESNAGDPQTLRFNM